jgi:hypothetical protein
MKAVYLILWYVFVLTLAYFGIPWAAQFNILCFMLVYVIILLLVWTPFILSGVTFNV